MEEEQLDQELEEIHALKLAYERIRDKFAESMARYAARKHT